MIQMITMKKSMKIRFNSEGDLALEKILRMYIEILIRCAFNDNNKYYSQVFFRIIFI